MKKILALALALVSLLAFSLAAACPAAAAVREPTALYDDYDIAFSSQISVLDWFFALDIEFMHYTVSAALYPWADAELTGWLPVTVTAEAFEAVLYRYFAPTDDQLASLRDACNYSADAQTYQIQAYSGFGGGLAPRRYMGYVANDDGTYHVFWQNITYLYLDTTDAALMSALEAAGWPSMWEYGGTVYRAGPDGYTAVASYDDDGRRYTVELVEGTVRFLACDNFTAADLPDAFDHVKQVSVTVPDGITVEGAADAFPDRSEIAIEAVTDSTALAALTGAFPETVGEWAIYALAAGTSPVTPFHVRVALPTLTEGETVILCVTDDTGAFVQTEVVTEQTEDGLILSVPIEAGRLPRFAVCVAAPDETDPPETSAPETVIPETDPPGTNPNETDPPVPVVPETKPSTTDAPTVPPVTVPPQTRPITEIDPPAVTMPSQSGLVSTDPRPTEPSVTSPEETVGEEKKGCGNAMALPALLPIALLAAALTKKKK